MINCKFLVKAVEPSQTSYLDQFNRNLAASSSPGGVVLGSVLERLFIFLLVIVVWEQIEDGADLLCYNKR